MKNIFLLVIVYFSCTVTAKVIPGVLSFDSRRKIVREDDGSVEVCIHSLPNKKRGINHFRVCSSNVEAKATSDYIPVDMNMTVVSGLFRCFQIQLINDDVREQVESFHLDLVKVHPGDAVTFVNESTAVIIIDEDHADTEEMPTSCTINEYLFVDEMNKNKEKTIEVIVNLLPIDVSVSRSDNITNEVYEKLAEEFEINVSPKGHDRFVAATDEINDAFTKACSSGSPGRRDDVATLAAKFRELLQNRISSENLKQARVLYGELLCYYEQDKSSLAVRARSKRQVIGSGYTPTECDCPDIVTKPCEFFACITVDEAIFIMGFGQIDFENEPCIGFAIDTTGSMRQEINATKRVIRTFLRSQGEATICYLLVPFNDHGPSDHPKNVGPLVYAITGHESSSLALNSLKIFEAVLNNTVASGGGDDPEYAYSAMITALNYSFIDQYEEEFVPMRQNSELIVITDAESKLEELKPIVIERAKMQGVRIHFVLSHDVSADYYADVADQTGGIVYDGHHTTWYLVNQHFRSRLSKTSVFGRKRRSISRRFHFDVSLFSYQLRMSTFTPTVISGEVDIVLPNTTVEKAAIENNVMIYLKSNPVPGRYYFIATNTSDELLVEQDTTLDVRMFFMNSELTAYSVHPSSVCTSGKLAVITSRISNISSLSLLETSTENSTRAIPLSKCSNAFIADYYFTAAGTYHYDLQGVDTLGISFKYEFDKVATVPSGMTGMYVFRSTNNTAIVMEFLAHFLMEFELISNEDFGTSNFTLSVNASGFRTVLNPSRINLLPGQMQVVSLNGSVGSISIGGGTTHNITVTASNGCTKLMASRLVTVRPMPIPRPSEAPAYVCGCQNGGTCEVLMRRGRTLKRCLCPPKFRGSKCQRRRRTL